MEEALAINFEQTPRLGLRALLKGAKKSVIQTLFSSIELWKHNFESISTRIVFGMIFSTFYIYIYIYICLDL